MQGRWFAVALLLALVALVSPALAITAGQVSNFQDGTTQGWVMGPVAPLPTNVATGGPAGAGDKWMRAEPGAHLAFFNPSDWAGNYTSAGVLDVGIDLLNPNANTLDNIADMRVVLFGPSGSRWSSKNFVVVPTDNVWHHYTFSLRQSDLTQVVAGDTYASTMANVQQLMFRHDNGTTPNSGGTPYLGSIMLTHSLNGRVEGLRNTPRDKQPYMGLVFYGFRVMFDNGIYYLHYNEEPQVPDWP